MRAAWSLALSGSLLAFGAGCSFVDPRAGAVQAACGLASGGAGQTAMGSAYYGASSSQTTAAPTCAANSGSACDDCENTHCCATRSACYGDPVCACADLTLDECLDAADSGASTQISPCWSAFAAKGAVEQARVSCQRAWCQAECSVP